MFGPRLVPFAAIRIYFTDINQPLAEVERVEGIEPSWLAWEARTLPLSYTRIVLHFSPSKHDGVTQCGPESQKRYRIRMKNEPRLAVTAHAQGDQIRQ